MHYHQPHWIERTIGFLLALTLAACSRSASGPMTPLPSLPPSTATLALASTATSAVVGAASRTAAVTVSPTDEGLASETPQPVVVTATTTPTAIVCGDALPTRLRVDAYAYVNPDPPLPNNLRSDAGQTNELIGEVQPGQAMQVVAGPRCADGSLWWQVRTLEDEVTGWTAEGDAETYWLVPCASAAECKP